MTSRSLLLRGNLTGLTVGNADHEAGVFLGKTGNSSVSLNVLVSKNLRGVQGNALDESIRFDLNVKDLNQSVHVNA